MTPATIPPAGAPAAPPTPTGAAGFSLVEVLASLALTGVFVITTGNLFQTAVLQHRLADETTRSTMLAQAELERLAALPSTSTELNPGTTQLSLPGNFTRRVHIVDDKPAPDAKTIKVTVLRGASSRVVTLIAIRPR